MQNAREQRGALAGQTAGGSEVQGGAHRRHVEIRFSTTKQAGGTEHSKHLLARWQCNTVGSGLALASTVLFTAAPVISTSM